MPKSILKNKGLIKAYVYERNLTHVLSKLHWCLLVCISPTTNVEMGNRHTFGNWMYIAYCKSKEHALCCSDVNPLKGNYTLSRSAQH